MHEQGNLPMPPEFAARGFEPEAWTPEDALAIGTAIQFGFSNTLSFDILTTLLDALVPEAADVPVFRPAGEAFIVGSTTASNRPPLPSKRLPWAPAHAERDALGAPQLHGRRWRVRRSGVVVRRRSRGAHWPQPLGRLGCDDQLADVMDTWEVPVEGGEVIVGGERVPIDARTEVIAVRAEDGTLEQRELSVREVGDLGVLLPDEILPVPKALFSQGELLFRWPGTTPSTELYGFFDFDRMKDLDEFEDAVDEGRTGMQNWMAASAEGIRYRTNGLVPDRGPIAGRPSANRIMDGTDPANLWSGEWLGRDRLPHLDGTQAFISSANNDPWGHTADNDPLNDEFYYGSFFAPGFRAARIAEVLTEKTRDGNVDRASLEELQTEVRDLGALGNLLDRGLFEPLLTEQRQRRRATQPYQPRAQSVANARLHALRELQRTSTSQLATMTPGGETLSSMKSIRRLPRARWRGAFGSWVVFHGSIDQRRGPDHLLMAGPISLAHRYNLGIVKRSDRRDAIGARPKRGGRLRFEAHRLRCGGRPDIGCATEPLRFRRLCLSPQARHRG